jgi:ABC-type Mn2+/Zn2+ transport system permease subunit
MGAEFVQFSLTPILIGILAAVACALPGNFLILRRQALIGDAISHVVLPGIVVAFLVTGHGRRLPMLLGAAGAALVAVVLIEASSGSAGSSRARPWASSSPRSSRAACCSSSRPTPRASISTSSTR